MKTACKNSNWFKSYGSLIDYASLLNKEKLDVTINRFQSHNAAFYDVIRGIRI